MGLFDKFKKTDTARKTIFDTDYPIDKRNWRSVFSACLGPAMAVQEACSEQVVKGQNWNVDFAQGTLSFGNQAYPVQFIGSESASSNTWKWGWDNVNNFPDALLELAHETKAVGEQWGLDPLSTANFDLDDTFNGHTLATVACALSKKQYGYYSGPHAGGAVLMAFSGVPASVFAPVDIHKFVSLSMQCLQSYPIDHKIFIESFLLWNSTPYRWDGQTIVADFPQPLHIEFETVEDFLRICSVKTK